MALPAAATRLPGAGVFAVQIGSSLAESLGGNGGNKRKRLVEEVIALRYAFKPASIGPSTPGILETNGSGGRQLVYDIPGGAQQVFDSREETGKSRECVLIWDEFTQTFTLHALPTTLHLTLNRSASSSRTSGRPPISASTASTSSTSSVPLSRNRSIPSRDAQGGSAHMDTQPIQPEAAVRPTIGGKGLPRKALPTRPPPEPKGKGRGKGGAKKATGKKTKDAVVPKGKIKSVEIIEDSDEEDEPGDEADDEFAKMVGQMMEGDGGQGGDVVVDDEDSSDEEEEEDDDDDDYLAGHRVAHNPGPGIYDQHSEWL